MTTTRTEPQITHAITVVTPEMAARWLDTNGSNRKVRESRVLKYREDMETGRWTFAGDPIRFGIDGRLQDGQHRLLALAEANVSGVAFLIVRGLPPEAKKVMDQGAKRTPGDQLAMLGHANANQLASAVKLFLVWERGYLFRDNKAQVEIGATAIEQWVGEHPEAVDRFQAVCYAARCTETSPALAGAAFLIFDRIDPLAAAEFITALAFGAGTQGDPVNALHQKLRRIRNSGQKVPQRDVLAMFIQAWNAKRAGRTLSHLNRPKGGVWRAADFPVAR